MSDESNTSPISLQSLLIPSKEVYLDFPGYDNLSVSLCHLAREELVKLRKRCTNTKFDKRTHQPYEELDDDLFAKNFTKAVVKNWKGFKLKYLETMLLVDITGQNPEDELPFTEDNAIQLMKNSSVFENWATNTSQDLENFTNNK